MALQRAALKAYLNADATLDAILTGGVFDSEDFDQDEGSTADIPYETGTARIKPFAVIRWRIATPKEIVRNSERRTAELYFYQQKGHAIIESAIDRCKVLLHRVQITADNRGVNMFHWLNDVPDMPPAQEFGNAACGMSRYYVDYTRI